MLFPGDNRVFIEDNITALDQFLVPRIPFPITEFPIRFITEKYAFCLMGCQVDIFLLCVGFASKYTKPL